jgi:hypothetical protein
MPVLKVLVLYLEDTGNSITRENERTANSHKENKHGQYDKNGVFALGRIREGLPRK